MASLPFSLLVNAYLFNNISTIKRIAAFRAKLGRMGWIFRLPTAFIAFKLGYPSRFGSAAFRAEFTLIHSTAGTFPSLGLHRAGSAAISAKLAGIISLTAAGADPTGGRSGCRSSRRKSRRHWNA